jgi:hypothetical protein
LEAAENCIMTIFTPFQILSLPNQGEWDYWGHTAHVGETLRISVRASKGKRLLGRYRRRWEHYINMDLHEMEFEGVE